MRLKVPNCLADKELDKFGDSECIEGLVLFVENRPDGSRGRNQVWKRGSEDFCQVEEELDNALSVDDTTGGNQQPSNDPCLGWTIGLLIDSRE